MDEKRLEEIAREVMIYQREGCDDVGEHPFGWQETAAVSVEIATRFAAEQVAEVVGRLTELRAEIKRRSGNHYCRSLQIARTVPCLGWEAKVRAGTYGVEESDLDEIAEMNNEDGRHRGMHEALALLDDALSEFERERPEQRYTREEFEADRAALGRGEEGA